MIQKDGWQSADEPWLVLEDFDFCFAENGLTAYRLGQQMASQVSMDWEKEWWTQG